LFLVKKRGGRGAEWFEEIWVGFCFLHRGEGAGFFPIVFERRVSMVQLRFSAFQRTLSGETLVVVGSDVGLGDWQPARAHPMVKQQDGYTHKVGSALVCCVCAILSTFFFASRGLAEVFGSRASGRPCVLRLDLLLSPVCLV